MGLVDREGTDLAPVRMEGKVTAQSGTNWKVWLTATQQEHYFPKDKPDVQLYEDSAAFQTYFCVVDNQIQKVEGLQLPRGPPVQGYHFRIESAEAEIVQDTGSFFMYNYIFICM